MHRRATLTLLIALVLAAVGAPVQAREANEIARDLEFASERVRSREQLVAARREAAASRRRLAEQAEAALADAQRKRSEAEEALKEVQELMVRFPDRVSSIEKERRELAGARQAEARAEALRDQHQTELRRLEGDLIDEETRLARAQAEVTSLRRESGAARAAGLREALARPQTVQARGEISCGEMSITDCREASLALAKRNAVEQASATLVESLTEVESFRLSRDRIRAEVRGVIVNFTILDSGFIEESGYFHEIRATVQGQVPEGLLAEAGADAPPPLIPPVREAPSADARPEEPEAAKDFGRLHRAVVYLLPGVSVSSSLTAESATGASRDESVRISGVGLGFEIAVAKVLSLEIKGYSGQVNNVDLGSEFGQSIPATGNYTAFALGATYSWFLVSGWEWHVGGGLTSSSYDVAYPDPALSSGEEFSGTATASGLYATGGGGYEFANGLVLRFVLDAVLGAHDSTRAAAYEAQDYEISSESETRFGLYLGYAFR